MGHVPIRLFTFPTFLVPPSKALIHFLSQVSLQNTGASFFQSYFHYFFMRPQKTFSHFYPFEILIIHRKSISSRFPAFFFNDKNFVIRINGIFLCGSAYTLTFESSIISSNICAGNETSVIIYGYAANGSKLTLRRLFHFFNKKMKDLSNFICRFRI